MAVDADQDVDGGPTAAKGPDDMAQDEGHLGTIRRLARAQDTVTLAPSLRHRPKILSRSAGTVGCVKTPPTNHIFFRYPTPASTDPGFARETVTLVMISAESADASVSFGNTRHHHDVAELAASSHTASSSTATRTPPCTSSVRDCVRTAITAREQAVGRSAELGVKYEPKKCW